MIKIDNNQDTIDSRDVINRIEDLKADEINLDEIETEELANLRNLAEQGADSSDWQYGEGLIRDSYFEEYAQKLAEDCGMVPDTDKWPAYCIDWAWAARELKHDYMPVDFDGVTYWIRG